MRHRSPNGNRCFSRKLIACIAGSALALLLATALAACGGSTPGSDGDRARGIPDRQAEDEDRGGREAEASPIRAAASVRDSRSEGAERQRREHSPLVAVSAGWEYSCGVRADGFIECWGRNDEGQASPPHEGNFVSVSAGDENACGLKTDGAVVCWGRNAASPEGEFASVSVGGDYACGLKTDSTLGCWAGDAPPEGEFTSVSAGRSHACAVKADGPVACWGDEEAWSDRSNVALRPSAIDDGQAYDSIDTGGYSCGIRLGDGRLYCFGEGYGPTPGPVAANFTSVSVGQEHACGITPGGDVLCAHRFYLKEPEHLPWKEPEHPYKSFSGELKLVSVDAGRNHTCGMTPDGDAVCWGLNRYGQATPPEADFASVSAWGEHVCGLKTDGSIACWGGPWDADTRRQFFGPSARVGIEGKFASVNTGNGVGCGVRTDGSAVCWGLIYVSGNLYTDMFELEGEFSAVSAGSGHVCGLKTDGSISCQAIHGLKRSEVTAPGGEFTSVSAGEDYTCGVRTDGSLECWGEDRLEQLTPPAGKFSAVSAGGSHPCAIRTDGYTDGLVECWGTERLPHGQARPAGMDMDLYRGWGMGIQEGLVTVSTGMGRGCGLTTEGSIKCWPRMADNPGEYAGKFLSVAAGTGFTCGVHTNGVLDCWGERLVRGLREQPGG